MLGPLIGEHVPVPEPALLEGMASNQSSDVVAVSGVLILAPRRSRRQALVGVHPHRLEQAVAKACRRLAARPGTSDFVDQ